MKSNLFTLLIFASLLYSCTSKKKENYKYYKKKNHALSQSNEYIKVFQSGKDTIKKWKKIPLRYWGKQDGDKSKIDEWVYLNSEKDKVILFVLERAFIAIGADFFRQILGEKIDGVWWFYDGANYVIPQNDGFLHREKVTYFDTSPEGYVNDSTRVALKFSTLSRIARNEAMGWYYKRRWFPEFRKGNYKEAWDIFRGKKIINDKAFDIVMNSTHEERKDAYLTFFINDKWKYSSEEDSLRDIVLVKHLKKHPNYWEEDFPKKADSLQQHFVFSDWKKKFDSIQPD